MKLSPAFCVKNKKEQRILHSVLRYSDSGPVLKELKTLFSYVCNICFQLKALKHCFKKLTRLPPFKIYIDLISEKLWFPLIKDIGKKQYVCKFNTKKKKLKDYWYQGSFLIWEIDKAWMYAKITGIKVRLWNPVAFIVWFCCLLSGPIQHWTGSQYTLQVYYI